MSTSLLVDVDQDEPGNVDKLKEQLTAATSADKSESPEQESKPEQPDIPDKYRG